MTRNTKIALLEPVFPGCSYAPPPWADGDVVYTVHRLGPGPPATRRISTPVRRDTVVARRGERGFACWSQVGQYWSIVSE